MNTTATRYAVRLHTVAVVCEHYTPSPDSHQGHNIDKPELAAALILDILNTVDPDGETFGFLAIDHRNRVVGFKILTIGTGTQAPVDGQKLFKIALFLDAHGIIIFHNHPSGDLEPSRQDLELTRRLFAGGQVIGISVNDHIITTADGRWVSLRESNPDVLA